MPVDEVTRILALFETHYQDFTVKHFHEKLVSAHGFTQSYSWTERLQAHGLLHQDGSTHQWVPGQWWDLTIRPGRLRR